MFDRLRTTEFQFDSGRRLELAPDVPLDHLFIPFSTDVLNTIKEGKIAVVGGESGLGKTEAFLHSKLMYREPINIHLGGLAQLCEQEDITYKVLDAGMGDFGNFLTSSVTEDALFIDEGMGLLGNDRDVAAQLQEIHEKGRMIVIVGGGPENANRQIALMMQRLGELDISDAKPFLFPPYLFRDTQAVSLLQIYQPSVVGQLGANIMAELDRYKIPKTFRVIQQCPPSIEDLQPAYFSTFRSHIQPVSFFQKLSEGFGTTR